MQKKENMKNQDMNDLHHYDGSSQSQPPNFSPSSEVTSTSYAVALRPLITLPLPFPLPLSPHPHKSEHSCEPPRTPLRGLLVLFRILVTVLPAMHAVSISIVAVGVMMPITCLDAA